MATVRISRFVAPNVNVHTVVFRPPPPTNIPFILTDGPQSNRVVLVVDADEEFVVGDVFEEDDMLWRIHQIELRTGHTLLERRPPTSHESRPFGPIWFG